LINKIIFVDALVEFIATAASSRDGFCLKIEITSVILLVLIVFLVRLRVHRCIEKNLN